MDSPDPNSPVSIASVVSDIEATAIVTALNAVAIEAQATGSFTAGFRAEAPGEIQIVVKQADADRARRALAELRTHPPTEIDWAKVYVGEPEE